MVDNYIKWINTPIFQKKLRTFHGKPVNNLFIYRFFNKVWALGCEQWAMSFQPCPSPKAHCPKPIADS